MVATRVSPPLTLERARELLTLDPDTGYLYWTAVADLGRKAGKRAGSKHPGGYRQIKIDRVQYLEHRVVWFLAHGEWPAELVDHRGRDRSDNRPSELRAASPTQNAQNQGAVRVYSRSGLLGVSWENGTEGRRRGRWIALIKVKGKVHRLGRFDDKFEAHAAYVEAKRKVHEHGTL